MSARQYKPIYMSSPRGIELIVYPVKDEAPLKEVFSDTNHIIDHVKDIYSKHSETLEHGQYHVLFAWNNDRHKMLDVWVHTVNEHSDSGPLLEFYGFDDSHPSQNKDIASGDSLIALAAEESKRRTYKKLDEYLSKKALPEFPFEMTPIEDYS